MDEEQRDMEAHKAYYNRLQYVADAQQGFPKSVLNDGLHFRQPWVMGVEEEVEWLKLRVHEHEKLLRECQELKAHVRMLVVRVAELERAI
ncbi:unnamed protein product [Eruca vesicaria subsp. sativa]|uniref:Uncharacterized protein n=1 Tax=Eruca vesicaria subsp. sativa TaxID=29727 RepID=A0ABC8JJ17_ERUVS|nr:unnamed protein product [Eruca vesicaria subsp. sativa]